MIMAIIIAIKILRRITNIDSNDNNSISVHVGVYVCVCAYCVCIKLPKTQCLFLKGWCR